MLFQRSLIEWRTVFWIAFVVFNVTNLVYIFYASGNVQPWNTPHLMNKSTDDAFVMEPEASKDSEEPSHEKFSYKKY